MNACVSCAFVSFSLTMPNNFDTLRPNENKNILINLMYSVHQLQNYNKRRNEDVNRGHSKFRSQFFVVFIVLVAMLYFSLERDHSFCLRFEFRSG